LNSPPPPLSFIPPVPHSRNSFIRFLFFIYIHGYTVFAPYSLSYNLSTPPPHPTLVSSPPDRTCYTLLFSDFAKERKILLV
jgi:hypothetical protein